MKGININDKFQPFTEQILAGEKTVETRDSPSLDPYLGKRIGIVRTGKGRATLVGYATISRAIIYHNKRVFDSHFEYHRVGKDSPFYIRDQKWGYEFTKVRRCKPRKVYSLGIVSREI